MKATSSFNLRSTCIGNHRGGCSENNGAGVDGREDHLSLEGPMAQVVSIWRLDSIFSGSLNFSRTQQSGGGTGFLSWQANQVGVVKNERTEEADRI